MNANTSLKFLTAVLITASCAVCRAGEPSALRADVKAQRVLFLGNSITRHGPAANIGWTTDWGMAATALEKDYVHVVAAALAELTGHKPEIKIGNIADFERKYEIFDFDEKLKDSIDFKADTIILAIGENVPGFKTEGMKLQFKDAVVKLLTMLKNRATERPQTADDLIRLAARVQPAIFVRSCFWADKTKDDLLRQACTEAGGTFVDISALGKDESNFARSEQKIAHGGVAAHPGDKGMKSIADAILAAMKAPAK